MGMFNEEIKGQLKEVFNGMKEDVTIALFTKTGECNTCPEAEGYMDEIEALSERIHLKKYDLEKDVELAKRFNILMTPSVALLDSNEQYKGLKFNGIPGGHEINSFIPALLEMSGAGGEVSEEMKSRIEAISKPVNIKVFVTLGCPHCPEAVQKAQKLALMSDHIDAEMIEAQTFSEISDQFNVSSVPKIIINDSIEFLGNQPFEIFLSEVEKAAKLN